MQLYFTQEQFKEGCITYTRRVLQWKLDERRRVINKQVYFPTHK